MKNLLIALSFALAGYLLSGCEGTDDLSALPDGGAQTDTLKTDTILVKPDTTPANTDTMPANTDTTKTATSCPATIQGTLVTTGVTYTILPAYMTATVTCDSKYDGYIPTGVTCEQLIQGYRTTQNYQCCIAAGDVAPDFVPYCGPYSNIGKSATCSADGKFVGWNCS